MVMNSRDEEGAADCCILLRMRQLPEEREQSEIKWYFPWSASAQELNQYICDLEPVLFYFTTCRGQRDCVREVLAGE